MSNIEQGISNVEVPKNFSLHYSLLDIRHSRPWTIGQSRTYVMVFTISGDGEGRRLDRAWR